MSGKVLRIVLAAIFIPGMVSVVFAQQPMITATIPFDFYVGNTLVHAGRYVIESPRAGVQVLRNKETKISVASVPTIAARAPEAMSKGTLIFNCYGADHFLSQIYWAGASDGREIVKHGLEAELARTAPVAGTTHILTGQF